MVIGGGAVIPVSPGPYERHLEFDPVLMTKVIGKGRKIELIGMKEIDAITCYDVRIATRELVWHYYFNVSNFLLQYWCNSPDETMSEALTKVFDYREFNKCLIPMSETKLRNGSPFFWSTITKLELNIDIDPTVFIYKDGDIENR